MKGSDGRSASCCTRVSYSLDGVHSEGDVGAGAVRQERGQGRLLKQAEDEDVVPVEGVKCLQL